MTRFHRYRSVWEHAELLRRLSQIRHVALDMDGTIYMGSVLFPWTPDFLTGLGPAGIGHSFLTNNPSKSIADYLRRLDGMGIRATREEMYTTTLATIDYLQTHLPTARRLFLLGTPSMISEFEAAGYTPTADSAEDVPDAVVVSFDMTLEYARLCRAAWWVKQGLPYLATNPDRVCPTDKPTVLVDCGSICAGIEYATGKKPDIVIGKPDPRMLDCIMEKYGLKPTEVAMAGDRIYTDILMAQRANALSILVLSGETRMDTVNRTERKPDMVLDDLSVFQEILEKVRG